MPDPIYIFIAAVVLFFVAKSFLGRVKPEQIAEMKSKVSEGGVVVDVRSPAEFQSGHVEGAVNIPLGQLMARLSEIDKGKAVVVCCRSGARSGSARKMLQSKGYEHVFDLGPWQNWNRG